MILLFTDFGAADLYVGQVRVELARRAPRVPVIDLTHEAPAFRIEAGAHLLAALAQRFPAGSIAMAVVDPGVGTSRRAVVLQVDDCYFVGPDNGLLSVIAARSRDPSLWEIVWRPEALSRSFHGRDLFAPIAARLALGIFPSDALRPIESLQVDLGAGDLAEVVYVDHYGNAMTGLRAGGVPREACLTVNGFEVRPAAVFGEVPPGDAFWYVNSIELTEIACNQASAGARLALSVGTPVRIGR